MRIPKLVRGLAVAGIAAATLSVVVPAWADGPGGSTEHRQGCVDDQGHEVARDPSGSCPAGSTEQTIYGGNEVTCGHNTDVGGVDVYAGPRGVETCGDDSQPLPIQGRIIAEADPDRNVYRVSADGDNNVQPNDPWIGIGNWPSGDPFACGDSNGHLDADHPTKEDGIEDGHCGRVANPILAVEPVRAAYDTAVGVWTTVVTPQDGGE
jgi:hypothetical protein